MAAADVVDEDTLEAVLALWRLDKGGKDAAGNVTGLPFFTAVGAGRAKNVPGAAPLKMPYCKLDCEQGPRPNERFTGQPGLPPARFDYRQFTFAAYGLKADVVKGMSYIQNWFGTFLGLPGKQTLTYPSGARFVWMRPHGDGKLEEDPDTKDGQDVWRGTLEYEIWSVRTDN